MPRYVVTALIVATALFMENLDGTVISTALPAIATDLKEDPIALKLALTSYLLSLAVFIPASGWAADRFGARTILRAAILIFTLGSLLCGLASTLPEFIGARVIQGFGGAMMVPVGRLVLLRSVPRTEMVRALSYLTVPALMGPIIGPLVGGFITTYFHWRWIFWINIPIGIIGIILASLLIENIREKMVWPLDVSGFLLSGMGLSALIFGFTVMGRNLLPGQSIALLIAFGTAVLILYVFHARRVDYPILDLRLLAIPTFRASVAGGFLFRIGIGAIPFLLPLMLQVGFGMSAFHSGTITFIAAAGAMAMKTTAAPILHLFGFRRVLVFNAILSAAILASYGFFRPSTPTVVIMGLLLIGGFFRSLEFTSVNAIAYADVKDEAMSRATSFASVMQQLSLSVGVMLGAGVIEITRQSRGEASLTLGDFQWAFLIVATVSFSSILVFWRLPKEAGSELAGRGGRPAVEQATSGQ